MKAKQLCALLLTATIITVFSGCEIHKPESSEIDSCQIDHDKVTFHVRYTNPEQKGNPITKTTDFTFRKITKDGQKYLQANSDIQKS